MLLLDRVKRSSPAERIVALCLAAGLLLWAKLALGAGPALAATLFGASLAWGCSAAAMILLPLFGLRLARRQPLPENQQQVVLLLQLVAGTGLMLTGALAVALTRSTQAPVLIAIGLMLAIYGFFRRHRAGARASTTLLGLLLVIVATEVPRERGVYSLSWSRRSSRATWSWSGSESCSSLNARRAGGGRPMKIAAYGPPYALRGHGLRGDLGGALRSRLLGARSLTPAGVARVTVGGDLRLDSPACYLPLFRQATLRGELRLNVHYTTGGGGRHAWAVNCNAYHTLQIDVEARLIGVGSCGDLRQHVAGEIVRRVHQKARAITGR